MQEVYLIKKRARATKVSKSYFTPSAKCKLDTVAKYVFKLGISWWKFLTFVAYCIIVSLARQAAYRVSMINLREVNLVKLKKKK